MNQYTKIFLFLTLILVGACKKKEVEKELETGTVTDIDGTTYQTVKIGDDWWMSENLNVTKYRDGTPITAIAVEDDSLWSIQTDGACSYIDTRYGRLYNWFAVTSNREIAPAGWHIPTDAEWKALEKELGMSDGDLNATAWRGTNQAEKLIPLASEGWPTTSIPSGTNKSGFSALPGGCRLFDGTINDQSSMAFWWTASEEGNQAWYRYLDSQKKNVFRHYTYKKYGFSIRCIKD